MTKAKAATAEPGHNIQDERAQFEEQTFLNVYREIKESKSEIGETMAAINEAYKRLKPLGFTKGDIKFAMELEEKDAGDVIATMRRRTSGAVLPWSSSEALRTRWIGLFL